MFAYSFHCFFFFFMKEKVDPIEVRLGFKSKLYYTEGMVRITS